VPKRSAGLLLYRSITPVLEVLLVHPGGPFYARKDAGVWSVPKGEYDPHEDPWATALREFEEEIGQAPPTGEPLDLGECTQKNGKVVRCFAIEADVDVSDITSNTFEMEWPPKSGKRQAFPEVDRAEWMTVEEARTRVNPAQCTLLDALVAALEG
jgi:predicted NUDIX family NTP pyrophosphohydrolase